MAENNADAGMSWPLLLSGIGMMLLFTADPRLLADAQGKADHPAVLLAGTAMSICIVRGVGYRPQRRWARALFSSPAALCFVSLLALRLLI